MKTTWETLNERVATKRALDKLAKQVDPASGMTLCVRRGVMHDSEDEDPDCRPWINVSICQPDTMAALITNMLTDVKFSIRNYRQWVAEDIEQGQQALKNSEGET